MLSGEGSVVTHSLQLEVCVIEENNCEIVLEKRIVSFQRGGFCEHCLIESEICLAAQACCVPIPCF